MSNLLKHTDMVTNNLHGIRLLSVAALAVMLVGCAKETKYDLQNIDTTVTVLKGVSIPLPNFEEIKLGSLIKLDESEQANSPLKVTSSGDYVISFKMDPQTIDGMEVAADALNTQFSDQGSFQVTLGSTATIPANTPLEYNKEDLELLKTLYPGVDFSFFENNDFLTQDIDQTISLNGLKINDFPKEVKALKNCALNGSFLLGFTPSGFPFTKITLKAGTKITFPSFMVLSGVTGGSFTLATNGHEIFASSDVAIPVGTGLALNITISGLDFGENGIQPVNGTLTLDGQVSVKGKINVNPDDFDPNKKQTIDYPDNPLHKTGTLTVVKEDVPLDNISLDYAYNVSINSVANATLKLSADAIPQPEETYGFDIQDLPDVLKGDNVVIGLSQVQLNLGINSKIPSDVTLSAKLKSLKGDQVTHNFTFPSMVFGKGTVENPKSTTYSIGDHADGTGDGGIIYKHLDGLGEILNPVPTRVEAYDFNFSMPEEWVTIKTATKYGAELNVGLEAPLAFTAASQLSVGVDVEMDLDMTSMKGMKELKAIFEFSALNTIPLSFNVKVTATDADKKPIEGITSVVTGSIEAGTIAQPKQSAIVVDLGLDPSKSIKGLRLDLDASSNAAVAGTCLNQNQSLTFTGLSITLPEGITADIKSLTSDTNNNK